MSDAENPRDDGDGDPDHRDRAIRSLAREDWATAADEYSLSAYGTLSGHEGFGRTVFEDRTSGGAALSALFLAGVCHRLAGEGDRATNRARQGALVATDLEGRVEAPADRGACAEFLGHFGRLAGDAEGAGEAYDRAADRYGAVDDQAGATTRPLLQAGTDLLTHLSRPDDVGWDDVHGTGADALDRRIRFCRSRVPEFLAAREEAGKLHAPRGSTEYGTDRFECPACGADDVNYVAGTTLCLRCSAATERV